MNPESLPTNKEVLVEKISQLLRQTIDSRVELTDYKIGNQKLDYIVLLAHLRHPSLAVVVKLAGPAAPIDCPFEQTAVLHHLVAKSTSIPLPEVIAVDSSYQTWSWRYFIKTAIPGQEWSVVRRQMSAEELAEAYSQIGDATAQLHNITFPAFGQLTPDGSIQGSKSYLAALQERVQGTIRNGGLREMFLSGVNCHASLFTDIQSAHLCHEDLHKHNILFQNNRGRWQLATILDFDKAWAGCPESDLARLELWEGMMSTEFWRSYKLMQPVSSLYPQRSPLFQLRWCFEYARSTSKHLANTNRICDVLGLPQVEQF